MNNAILDALDMLLLKVQRVLDIHPPGANPAAIDELKQLAAEATIVSGDNRSIVQKCENLVDEAQILYAPRVSLTRTRDDAAVFVGHALASMQKLVQAWRLKHRNPES